VRRLNQQDVAEHAALYRAVVVEQFNSGRRVPRGAAAMSAAPAPHRGSADYRSVPHNALRD
jgi:hypothetical protein